MRENIVEKLNSGEAFFKITYEEMNYIVKDWISTQSQHHVKDLQWRFTPEPDIEGSVELDRGTIYRH
jgi:hypothetical protein